MLKQHVVGVNVEFGETLAEVRVTGGMTTSLKAQSIKHVISVGNLASF